MTDPVWNMDIGFPTPPKDHSCLQTSFQDWDSDFSRIHKFLKRLLNNVVLKYNILETMITVGPKWIVSMGHSFNKKLDNRKELQTDQNQISFLEGMVSTV